MCYHVVPHTDYLGCGHRVPGRAQFVDCNLAKCKRSRYHYPHKHICDDLGCTDMLLPDQCLVMETKTTSCPSCSNSGGSSK
ncbi:hypothetical protein ABKN59_006988 [Abortiporus biennis]